MENFRWIFDGIGSTMISFILGIIIGGRAGYTIGIRQGVKQKQKAGKNSQQTQTGIINNHGHK